MSTRGVACRATSYWLSGWTRARLSDNPHCSVCFSAICATGRSVRLPMNRHVSPRHFRFNRWIFCCRGVIRPRFGRYGLSMYGSRGQPLDSICWNGRCPARQSPTQTWRTIGSAKDYVRARSRAELASLTRDPRKTSMHSKTVVSCEYRFDFFVRVRKQFMCHANCWRAKSLVKALPMITHAARRLIVPRRPRDPVIICFC